MPRKQNKRVIASNTFLPLLLLLFFFLQVESFSVLHSQKTGRERRLNRKFSDYFSRHNIYSGHSYANKESANEDIDDCTTKHVLQKYGLVPSQLKSRPLSFLRRQTLPGSYQEEKRLLRNKLLQVMTIFLLSHITKNRIRLQVNLIRWAIFTFIRTFCRYQAHLVASLPSLWHRSDDMDKFGIMREKYWIKSIENNKCEQIALLKQVTGDGSCLFYAIASSLLYLETNESQLEWEVIEERAKELRCLAVHTLQNPNLLLTISKEDQIKSLDLTSAVAASFGMSCEQYLANMKRSRCWGGGPEIIALSNALKCSICLYHICDWKTSSTAMATTTKKANMNQNIFLKEIFRYGEEKHDFQQKLHILISKKDSHIGCEHFLAVFPIPS